MNTAGAVPASSKQTQVMGSFASLISCALNATNSGVQQPFKLSAVQLPFFISASQDSSTSCCTVSSLQIRHDKKEAALFPRSLKPLLESAAASNLRRQLKVRKSELQGLPMELLWNVSQSFIALVDSRLRSSLAALVRQSCGGGKEDDALTRVLVGLLSASSSPINPTMIVTTFRTLPFSKCDAVGDYIMPLIFEVVIDLNILGTIVAVTVEAPGTVQGSFSCNSEEAGPAELLKVDIQIDTAALLISMMAQARLAVRKAVGFAAVVAPQVLLASSSSNTVSDSSRLHDMNSAPSLFPELVRSKVVEDNDPVSGSENHLMPPPPARAPSSNSLEMNEKKIPSSSAGVSNENHSWNETEGKVGKWGLPGLNLLTAAFSGLKRACVDDPCDLRPDSKKQRAATLSDVNGVGADSAAETSSPESSMDQEQPSSHAGDDLREISTTIAKV
jgi:hypothetical protein